MFATAIGIALMCQSLPAESFHDIWNPAAALFPFLLLLFLGWSLACGQRRLLPLTALVASYVIADPSDVRRSQPGRAGRGARRAADPSLARTAAPVAPAP